MNVYFFFLLGMTPGQFIDPSPSLQKTFEKQDRAFVTVFLDFETWPESQEDRRSYTQILQDVALEQELGFGFEIVRRYQSVPAMAGWLHRDTYATWLQAKRKGISSIKSIDLDVGGSQLTSPSHGAGGLADSVPLINASTLHAQGITGAGIEVAVLDTGFDSDHPDLQGALIAESCFCFKPSANCCPNGQATQTGLGSAEDDHGHGTHVTGIITSAGVQAAKGVAPDSAITAVKVLDSNNSFNSTADITSALDWLYNNRPNVRVVSMSLFTFARATDACDTFTSWSQAMFMAIQNLVDRGVYVVTISGNDGISGELPVPGCLSNVVTVGASTKENQVAQFSNSHPLISVLAPGQAIVSSAFGGGTVNFSGTSMACPHVSGSAALLMQSNPNLTPTQITAALIDSGIPITDRFGLSKPRIDVAAAYQKLAPATRWVPHVTAAAGGFQTSVSLYNREVLLKKNQIVDLFPFDAAGNPLTVRTVELAPGQVFRQDAVNLFGGEVVSHFAISGSEDIRVNLAYQANTANAATAHVPEFGVAITQVVFEPAEWDLVFDGMAVVNSSDFETTLVVTQFDSNGGFLNLVNYTQSQLLPPNAKQLVLFSNDFTQVPGAYFKVETSAPTQVILLRGTYPGTSPAYLFQTVPLSSSSEPLILKNTL